LKEAARKPFGLEPEEAHGPFILPPEPVSFSSLSITDKWGPGVIPNPRPEISPMSSPELRFPLPLNSVDPLPIPSRPCTYKSRLISSLACDPFFSLSTSRLLAKELAISQTPTAGDDDSGELRPPQAFSYAPFPFLSLCAPSRHAHFSSCAPDRRVHPRPDLTARHCKLL
jgi:hypothetical protein